MESEYQNRRQKSGYRKPSSLFDYFQPSMIIDGSRSLSIATDALERFSNECRKTKTKAITLTNHNRNKTQNEPIRNQIKYKQLALSAENACEQVTIGFGFTPDWLRKWREFF